MSRIMRLLRIIFCTLLVGCTSLAAKEQTELGAGRRIGLTPDVAFKYVNGVKCYASSGESGCLVVSMSGCQIWYVVDEKTNTIVSWRYASDPKICWKLRGV